MDYPISLLHALDKFYTSPLRRSDIIPRYLDNADCFSMFVYLRPTEYSIEIPLFSYAPSSASILISFLGEYSIPSDYCFPFILDNSVRIKKNTFNGIMTHMVKFIGNPILSKYINKTGSIFYVGKGICYAENKLRYLATLRFVANNDKTKYECVEPVLYIDSSVFQNRTEFFNKGIVDKLIPILSRGNIQCSIDRDNDIFYGTDVKGLVDMRIKDLREYLYRVRCSESVEFFNGSLNETLNDNIPNIVRSIQNDFI